MPAKQPAQIRETYKRQRMPLPWAAHLDDARKLCAGWHSLFGACLVLDDDRLRAIMRRLVDDQFSFIDVGWAIRAYREHCTTDDWHRRDLRGRCKTFANFLRDERFEDWVQRGRELADARRRARERADQRRGENDQVRTIEALWAEFRARPNDQQLLYMQQAVRELELAGPYLGRRNVASPLVRAKILQRLQKEAADAARTPPRAGEVLREVV